MNWSSVIRDGFCVTAECNCHPETKSATCFNKTKVVHRAMIIEIHNTNDMDMGMCFYYYPSGGIYSRNTALILVCGANSD